MNCIIGKNGFIGSHLADVLEDVTEYPTKDTKVIYDFGSPTHQYWNDYCTTQATQRIISLAEICKKQDILYVFASSALVYEKGGHFTASKLACETLLLAYGIKYLILRMWPIYGDTEVRKGDNAAVIDIWTRDMKLGIRPVIWGDGKQERGFVYIHDAVTEIVQLVEDGYVGIADIKREPVSFNHIVKAINKELGTKLKPKYIKAPKDYSLKSPDGI